MRNLCPSLPLAALLAVCAALVVGAASAGAARKASGTTPCWRLVLNDEYDGHIDGRYPVHCYKDAISHLPEDSLIYGQLKQDITRAMLNAIGSLKKKGVKVNNNTVLPSEDSSRDLQSHKKKKGFIAAIADKIGPGNASSIPLPLLILAGLGLLLVAAAGASFAARWLSARRNQPRPATSPPTPRRK
ncbi:MAG TPA: hypothetical protein VE269_00010 [Gaiellaceae bacterium]|nr:hypothetical protein [Gaiellaceae bacterium]